MGPCKCTVSRQVSKQNENNKSHVDNMLSSAEFYNFCFPNYLRGPELMTDLDASARELTVGEGSMYSWS